MNKYTLMLHCYIKTILAHLPSQAKAYVNRILHCVLVLGSSQIAYSQTFTTTLRPDQNSGKDAFIESRLVNANYASHPDFAAIAWTNGGVPVNVRGLIDFDLSSIPSGALINKALLNLYSYNSLSNGSHSTRSGSNESILSRIISPWTEESVTWNNQPLISNKNEVHIPSSTNPIQHYEDIDVTLLIKDIIENKSESFGLQIRLKTEQYYRSLIFASSDNPDSLLHPKLEIIYTIEPSDGCFTLQPNGVTGKDAFIENRLANTNYGNHPDFAAIAWTNGGVPVNARGLVDFDLSSIPRDARIDSAYLSLYSYVSTSNGSHSTRSGSNESVISRITTPWDEKTVTWNTQPTITIENEVYLPSSTSSVQNYLNIDITNLLRDWHKDAINSHGLLFKLKTENFFRSIIFASSDNPDSTLHPKLKICFKQKTTNVNEKSIAHDFKIYPNPAINYFTVELSNKEEKWIYLEVINSAGQIIKRINNKNTSSINISNISKGLYFVKVYFDDNVSAKKIIIK